MLVLTRRDGEGIILKTPDFEIEVIVFGQRHGQTKVGIKAPKNVEVIRNELAPPRNN